MVSRETSDPSAEGPDLPPWLNEHRGGLTAFAELLAGIGVERGLIGPREVPRIWQRHILNCAVVADPDQAVVPAGARIADVGSGAGLPGLVWAISRPDVQMTLVEPLLRRATFLSEAVTALGLAERVTVRRDRAEDVPRDSAWTAVDIVTARAVAPLERLIGWTVPLLRSSGALVALKGSSAADELAAATQAAKSAGLTNLMVRQLSAPYLDVPTTVITGERSTAQ
jgi:16S rRNA (guanine527-N7)-methyltransferase